MFGRKSPQVVVAGAGPVGLFTALTLARQGVDVLIADPHFRQTGHSYALALHPASLRLLNDLGLLDDILAECHRIPSIGIYDKAKLRASLSMADADDEYPFVAVMPQSAFETILVNALKKEGVKVLWNHRVAAVKNGTDHASVTIHRLDQESRGYGVYHTEWVVTGEKQYDVAFVIGADGHSSFVRQALDIDFPSVGKTQHFAVFEFKTDAAPEHDLAMALHADTLNAMWTLPGHSVRWSFELLDFQATEDSRQKESYFIQIGADRFSVLSPEELKRLLAERVPWFKGSSDDIRWRLAARFERRLAASYGRGRVWLAGDATHMTGPVGVQSMNMGLLEAQHLGSLTACVVRGDSSDILNEYEARWLPQWRFLLGLDGGLQAADSADAWGGDNAARILPCLPATGDALTSLVAKAGLKA